MNIEETEKQKLIRTISERNNPYAKEYPNRHLWSEGFRAGNTYSSEQCQKRDELIKLMYQMLVDYSNKKYKHSDIWLEEWNKVEQLKKELK